MRARPFNHLGPGQRLGFVAPDFAMQIAQIEAGLQEPVIRVGSLDVERDFTDVRDIVCAYRLIMERGNPGEAYNVATGTVYTIRYLLETLLGFSEASIRIEVDPALLRPSGRNRSWGDASRLRKVTRWEPTIPIERTLLDVLNDCRQRVQIATQE
jgi:GDP-4-dehydro-6-deoxy-D-mannose reductase